MAIGTISATVSLFPFNVIDCGSVVLTESLLSQGLVVNKLAWLSNHHHLRVSAPLGMPASAPMTAT
jgi:hypothetical protein